MSREIISPEGLREDGRRVKEVRKVQCQLGAFSKVDGSAIYEQGNTKIIATVYGPREVRIRSKALHDRAVVTCEFSTAAFARSERKARSKADRQAKESALLIKQTFESSILTHLYPRSQISIFIQVLQSDEGVIPAAINATTLALINAGIPMKSFVCACSAGFIENQALVDLNASEKASGAPILYLAICPKSDKVILSQFDAKMAMEHMEDVLDLAMQGAKQIYQVLKEEVNKHAQSILHTRGMLSG